MDFVNKKISKAKQSISQLQTEGGLMKSMGLQSPGLLHTLSLNSSTNTLLNQSTGAIKEAKIFLVNPVNDHMNDEIDRADHEVV